LKINQQRRGGKQILSGRERRGARRTAADSKKLKRALVRGFLQIHAMQPARQLQNLALIGFMGTGKTSVGRLVAEILKFDFLDTDDLIEKCTGRSISDIFSKDGEPAFRALEKKVVEELANKNKTVIATGGGLPTNADNLAGLKSCALVVCLWASPEKIWERVRHQSHRPLLHDADPQQKIRDLLAAREPFYRQADVLVNTGLRSPREVAQQIALQFKLAGRTRA
jgi:shikimate kinase